MNKPKSLISDQAVQSTSTLPTVADSVAVDVAALVNLKRPRWQRFVVSYITQGNRAKAAIAAGYSPRRADQAAYKLENHPAIAEAIRAVRRAMAERQRYTLDKLVADFDSAAAFAIETGNATALVRAREAKGKAMGLLVDRIDARVQNVPFRLVIGGIDDGKPQ
jgi:phage terminase small subunit